MEFLSFDDVVIVPSKANVEPSEVDVTGKVTKGIELSVPIVSSPMDTVTEWRLAVALARIGGVGVIHRNMSVEEQASMVMEVKRANPSPWAEVPRSSPEEPIVNALMRMSELGAGASVIVDRRGFHGVIVSSGDASDMWASKARYFYMLMESAKPLPTIDEDGRLRVGAAVSPFDIDRARRLESSGADFLVLDVAHLHNEGALRSASRMAKEVSVDLVAGNLGTKQGVLDTLAYVEEVAGLRVGISSGSICKTGEVAGAGVPTLTAIMEARRALEELGQLGKIPIIADGGLRKPGDFVKAFIAGASAAMSGRLLASTEESPSPKVRVGDRIYKAYRGMGSAGAMERRRALDRYYRPAKLVEEGVEGLVEYSGSLVKVVFEVVEGIKAGLGYAGASSIEESWKVTLAKATVHVAKELKPHDVILSP